MSDDKGLRRSIVSMKEPAELAIYNAIIEVEKLPADVRLSTAVCHLLDASRLVSDFIDEQKSRR